MWIGSKVNDGEISAKNRFKCCRHRCGHSEQQLSKDLRAHWQRIRGDLERIYELANTLFADEEKDLFFEYVTANELGLAYELICDRLHEAGSPISAELYRLIQSAGSLMEYEPQQHEKLKPLIRL
jgi:hypothetical protein